MKTPIVALASGSGSLLEALIDATRQADYPAEVVAVGVDRPCRAIEVAKAAGIPVFTVDPRDFAARTEFDAAITERVSSFDPQFVVTLGYMRVLGAQFVEAFAERVINSHPSLLPAFAGAHAVRDALAYGARVTGCTVHVVNDGVDTGPILEQRALPIESGEDETALHERIKVIERQLVVEVMAEVVRYGIQVEGRKATIKK